jgi:hypothetical protein
MFHVIWRLNGSLAFSIKEHVVDPRNVGRISVSRDSLMRSGTTTHGTDGIVSFQFFITNGLLIKS